MRRRPLLARSIAALATALGAAAIALALPAGAGANAYTQVYRAFQQTGSIKPCQFSAATLKAAQSETPSFDQQYDADFPDSVQSALNAQVGGVCAGGAKSSVLGGAARPLSGSGGGPLPASVDGGTSSGIPLALLLLAILVGLLAIAGAAFAVAWRAGVESPWMADWRHACEEASFQLSGRWLQWIDRGRRR